ncbi:MAG: caspase family protein [Lewinellaceae bacterium]|nr:caspase family protein [Phaeodactylibacter sp.]MCB9036327.1 caspase family protein [Lewinellaceae bacterium]
MMMRWAILCVLLLINLAFAFGQNRAGKDRALLFAANDYAAMTDLKNPIQNARDIAAELERRYGFEAEVVPNPSFEKVEAKIKEYQRAYRSGKFPSDGQLFLFFSGHGTMRGKNGYFMPTNADPERPFATAMEYDYWRSEIDAIDCRHILVAIDACHSITFDPNWEKKPDRKFNRPGEQYADQTLLNHQQYRARLFFTSDAKGDQTPDRSTFARQLLEGLRTHQAAAGYLTSSELFASYMLKAAPTPGGSDFGSDEPGSCFLFFLKPPSGNSSFNPEETNALEKDLQAWKVARETNTIHACQAYLRQFPKGEFRGLAADRIQMLEQEAANRREELDWEIAKEKNDGEAYKNYLEKYPGGKYNEEARRWLAEEEWRKQKEAEARRKREEFENEQREAEARQLKESIGGLFGVEEDTSEDPDVSQVEEIRTETDEGFQVSRGVVRSLKPEDNSRESGKVVVMVCIDRDGNVISADFNQNGSTTRSSHLIQLSIDSAKKWKFTPADVDRQCGKIIFNFRN